MICQLFGCLNETTGNYTACSREHGIRLRMEKEQIASCFNANESMKPWGTRELYTVKQAEYYGQA